MVDRVRDNDEKVASSKKHTKFKIRVQKIYPKFRIKLMVKLNTLFMTKMAEKTYLWGLHIPIEAMHKRSSLLELKYMYMYNDSFRK